MERNGTIGSSLSIIESSIVNSKLKSVIDHVLFAMKCIRQNIGSQNADINTKITFGKLENYNKQIERKGKDTKITVHKFIVLKTCSKKLRMGRHTEES